MMASVRGGVSLLLWFFFKRKEDCTFFSFPEFYFLSLPLALLRARAGGFALSFGAAF